MDTTIDESDSLEVAHKRHSIFHRDEILASKMCGCFHCLYQFPPAEIVEWTDKRNEVFTTAVCPRCGVDAILGSKSGFPISRDFLRRMRDRWFDPSKFVSGLIDESGSANQ